MPRPRTRPRIKCPVCYTETVNSKFCSNRCQHTWQRAWKLNDWVGGKIHASDANGDLTTWARDFIIDMAQNQCPECGWSERHPISGKCPLQIDHVDGDSSNNWFVNVIALCPNCHALTETWGGYNKNVVRARLGLPLIGHQRAARRHFAAKR